jgi:hypothetical protein
MRLLSKQVLLEVREGYVLVKRLLFLNRVHLPRHPLTKLNSLYSFVMPAFVPLEDSEEERLQQALFTEIIRLAPEGAELLITPDSWPGIPGLLEQRLVVQESMWVVALVPTTREFLVQQAHTDNFQTKMVHFYISDKGRDVVTSYDGMCGMILEPTFPDYPRIITEYAALGIIMT